MMEDLFADHGTHSDGLLHVSPAEAAELCSKGALLVDVREKYLSAFKKFGVKEIICMPLSHFAVEATSLPADRYIIVADSAGLHSKEAAKSLLALGYRHVANLAGGLVEWDRDGMPLATDKDERLSGSCMCQLRPREKK